MLDTQYVRAVYYDHFESERFEGRVAYDLAQMIRDQSIDDADCVVVDVDDDTEDLLQQAIDLGESSLKSASVGDWAVAIRDHVTSLEVLQAHEDRDDPRDMVDEIVAIIDRQDTFEGRPQLSEWEMFVDMGLV